MVKIRRKKERRQGYQQAADEEDGSCSDHADDDVYADPEAAADGITEHGPTSTSRTCTCIDGQESGSRNPRSAFDHRHHHEDKLGQGVGKWMAVLVSSLCILVAADVTIRLLDRRNGAPTTKCRGGSSPFTAKTTRWVPTVDILNASSPSRTAADDVSRLKYLDDVSDYGLQGLALSSDDGILYEFHTMAVRVLQLDESGSKVVDVQKRRIYNGTVDFPRLLDGLEVAHIGGIDLSHSMEHGIEIWIATHSDGVDGRGALFAVDPTTLDVKATRLVNVPYNLDWVAYRDGVLYYGVFFNVRLVHRVELSTLHPLPDLVLSLPEHLSEGGINYVQSASFDLDGHLILLGDDYQCTIYCIDIESGSLLGTQALLLGSETDGVTFDRRRRTMLVGFNRQHSHEQVMQMEPMISVIRMELYSIM